MLVIQQSKYDIVFLVVVVVLCIAANLPDGVAPIDKRVVLATLVVTVAISLIRYVRIGLVLVTAVLVAGANLPEDLAERFGIDPGIMLLTLGIIVMVAIFNHYAKKMPKGVEPEFVARSAHGAQILFTAVMAGNIELAETLIKSGVNVNMRTLTGKTPLMAAVFKGHVDIVQLLLSAGASVNAQDSEGNTALSIARFKGFSKLVAHLKMAGAEEKPEFLDVAGITNRS